jgi:hypothetical protein
MAGRPKFRKAKQYRSFTFPQSGYKVEGSKRYKRARRVLAKHQITLANKRQDHHFKLAHLLYGSHDVRGIELGRDHNTAINIKTIGASLGYPSERKPKVRLRTCVDGRNP